MADKPARARIAPSPTGDPHVGTAYMGLVNMVLARQTGGQFIVRIDDTDQKRYREGSEQAIYDALAWLGIEWDEGPDKGGPHAPYRQSERTQIYLDHVQQLLEAGKAYRCFCTEERLNAMRAEQRAAKAKLGYDRHCRELAAEEVEGQLASGAAHVVRFKVPTEGETVVQDLLRGEVAFQNVELRDQILLKADGFPTYHLASVVDDHLFEITHIIRAEEWLTSAPLHHHLFAAFGWEMPILCHMNLLRNTDKSRISKRKNPTSVLYYRDAGFLPEALLNFLGLMGWSGPRQEGEEAQEIFSVPEMIEHFRLEDIRMGAPVFDIDKLRHVNHVYLQRLEPGPYADLVRDYLFDEQRLQAMAPLVQPRAQTLGQVLEVIDFFLGDVSHIRPEDRKKKDPKLQQPVEGLVPKQRTPEETWFTLTLVMDRCAKLDPWTVAGLEPVCRTLAEEEEWKTRELFMTLRVAMTGKAETPPLFESMEILGKPRCLGRLVDAMRTLGEPSKKAKKRWEKARREREKQLSASDSKTGSCPRCGSSGDPIQVEVNGKLEIYCTECRPK